MKLDFAHTQKLLKGFDFPTLFREELGWEPMRYSQDVTIAEEAYHLEAQAHKRGFTALRCHGQIPPYAIRRKIDAQIAKYYREHLIIYTDTAQTVQVWQWVKRQIGKPASSREHTFRVEQSGQALIQKLDHLAVTLDDEASLTILDVADGVSRGFDVERVTRRFYERFKEEHAAFLKFVAGIPDENMQRWYVSVTLNRLMFVYFIQKKGFLNGNLDYLPQKLTESQKQGKDHFYHQFLCPLFFKGFASSQHDAETTALLGDVPYLNGGIFTKHQIEELYGEKLDIPDQAFERLFAFFNDYQWHLDERPTHLDNEINPDVLGYIFEKYINQKQMGAYYTKEDITEYISKNTVIPHLFDVACKECKIAFEGDRSVWNLLQENPDRYIHTAVRKGMELTLPAEIEAGIKDVSKRTEWNRAALEEFALPTEIWREVVSRRQRYEELYLKMVGGEMHEINDLITNNLDIRQFAQDVIENTEGPELLRAFWKAIREVTVLDPTVGSGAFLFAALNILEPLYEACLERMQVFVDELDSSSEVHHPEKFSDFRKVLAEVEHHPNPRYFVLKSIIIHNLYGVDIMDEAVEICKLRLFLKLVAQVEPVTAKVNKGLEPLPDIDFNIRAGNTLVGFGSKEDVRKAVVITSGGQMKLVSTEDNATLKKIEEKAEAVERLFTLFRQQQTELGGEVRTEDKTELKRRLKDLEDELNIHLARQYGIHDFKSKEFNCWRDTHKPFHWFVEFYGIMHDGGFNVIIGNPPYVEYSQIRQSYTIQNYATEECGNLYAYIWERCDKFNKPNGRQGLIVPSSGFTTRRAIPLAKQLLNHTCWFSFYDFRPSKLFDGVNLRLAIGLIFKTNYQTSYSTTYNRWYTDERCILFSSKLHYQEFKPYNSLTLKLGEKIEQGVWNKINHAELSVSKFASGNKAVLYFHDAILYWIRATDFAPIHEGYLSSHVKTLDISNDSQNSIACSLINSALFYWWWIKISNCRDLSLDDVKTFKFPMSLSVGDTGTVQNLHSQLMKDLLKNSQLKTRNQRHTGIVNYREFNPVLSKPIIDKIDRVLARHYGLTDEESDFIINYDIKYRMGSELDSEE